MDTETNYDRHERHMKPIREAQNNKTIIPIEKWVGLYAQLSNYILEYGSLDPVWTIDENGSEVYTKEKQDQFIDISNAVEDIMRKNGLIKQGEENE